MLKQGMVTTVAELNEVFIGIYRNMNGILPDRALTITSGQLYYYVHGNPNSGMQYPGNYGMQYFDNDDSGLLTKDIVEKINRVL